MLRNDETAAAGSEEAIRDVDGDALLAFGLQPVEQESEVDSAVCRAETATVALRCPQLIVRNGRTVVEQAADQGGLAVVHAAAGQKAQDAGSRRDWARHQRVDCPLGNRCVHQK